MDLSQTRSARPHQREVFAQVLTPLATYRRLREHSTHAFLIDSVTGGDQVSRYSFLGAELAQVCSLCPDRLEIERDGEIEAVSDDPLAALRCRLDAIRSSGGSLPFAGGDVGDLGYDLVRLAERLPAPPADPYGLPIALEASR